jgi:hypothetical protein
MDDYQYVILLKDDWFVHIDIFDLMQASYLQYED